jgi:hypothetical protein
MRNILRRFGFAPILFTSLASCFACGGSSSETPPPLEPDPRSFMHRAPDSEASAKPLPPPPEQEPPPVRREDSPPPSGTSVPQF